ncbi:MAG: FAD-dependent oxidoreductase [Christensenellales bacterium]
MKVVIIGGVAGGASAAARLRRLDEKAEIILLESGSYISFANCGLPYYIGGEISDKNALILQTPESFFNRFNIDVRISTEAVLIDTIGKKISVKNLQTGETYSENYDKLVLSPGAKPVIPLIPGAVSEKVFTLRNIPDTIKIKEYIEEKLPRSVVVVGGGYIGIEMAENLKKGGLDVSIVEMADHCIASLDYDMACEVHNYLQEKNIHLFLNSCVKAIEDQNGKLKIILSNGKILTDMVLLSVGVRPDTDLAKASGLLLDAKGAIIVNKYMQTSDENIFAIGDAVGITHFVTGGKGHIPLAGPANKQGRIAADNICGLQSSYKNTQGSSVLKLFDMTVACTGINEASAKAAGISFDKMFTYSPSHAGYYPGAHDISIKTIFEKETGRILGAQLIGFDGVDKRCDVLAVAIRAKMTAYDLTELELCYAPPFSSAKDPVNFVGYTIENLLTGKIKTFHWHDVADLPRDGSVSLVDVRTKQEYDTAHIKDFMNMPIDELRKHVRELDVSKPVYVYCRSGLRSYIACRILMGNGYNCYNLSGGFRLYDTIFNNKISENYS